MFFLDKSDEFYRSIPIIMADNVPFPFRRFCCLVICETTRGHYIGSGVLTDIGLITAHHLVRPGPRVKEVYASFILEGNEWTTVDLGETLAEDKEKDIVVFLPPSVLSPFFAPIEIGWRLDEFRPYSRNIDSFEWVYIFGCPHGLLGKVWIARFIAISNGSIYTKGFGCPGVSGGGVFTKVGETWKVWAINSTLYTGSKTLVSRLIADV
jgi:hypothetical protein